MSIEASQTESGLTVFQRILTGEEPGVLLYNNEAFGVAAALAIKNAAIPGEVVVFTHERGIPDKKGRHLLTRQSEDRQLAVDAVAVAVTRKLYSAFDPQVVIKHAEGHGVDSPHEVVAPSYERGDWGRNAYGNPSGRRDLTAAEIEKFGYLLCFSELEVDALDKRVALHGVQRTYLDNSIVTVAQLTAERQNDHR